MKLNSTTQDKIWGLPCKIDHDNKLVYIKCTSSTTAMGIDALVKKYFPGYSGKIVSELRSN